MGLFKSKAQKAIEKKMLVKKTINSMNRHINKLEEQKKVYAEAAARATQQGLPAQVNLAISGLKMSMAQQKKAKEMLLNFEITSQMKDMAMMTTEFLGGLSMLSKEMVKLTDSKEFAKVQMQFELAMEGVQTQTTQLDSFLEDNQSNFATASGNTDAITDAEILSFINEQAGQSNMDSDTIEKELEELRKRMAKS